MNVIQAVTHYITRMTEESDPGMKVIFMDKETDRPDRGVTPAEREREEAAHAASVAAAHTTSIKLGDLASNIITRNFCSPTTSIMHQNNRFSVGHSEGYVSGGDADERTKPLAFPTTAYAYPYSALNVATTPGDSSNNTTASQAVPTPCPPPPPEPAPLMSAQYEPLSDED